MSGLEAKKYSKAGLFKAKARRVSLLSEMMHLQGISDSDDSAEIEEEATS